MPEPRIRFFSNPIGWLRARRARRAAAATAAATTTAAPPRQRRGFWQFLRTFRRRSSTATATATTAPPDDELARAVAGRSFWRFATVCVAAVCLAFVVWIQWGNYIPLWNDIRSLNERVTAVEIENAEVHREEPEEPQQPETTETDMKSIISTAKAFAIIAGIGAANIAVAQANTEPVELTAAQALEEIKRDCPTTVAALNEEDLEGQDVEYLNGMLDTCKNLEKVFAGKQPDGATDNQPPVNVAGYDQSKKGGKCPELGSAEFLRMYPEPTDGRDWEMVETIPGKPCGGWRVAKSAGSGSGVKHHAPPRRTVCPELGSAAFLALNPMPEDGRVWEMVEEVPGMPCGGWRAISY